MRDLIWTAIIVWLAYKLYEAFKGVSQNAQNSKTSFFSQNRQRAYNQNPFPRDGEVKVDKGTANTKQRINTDDAEYVDYEEVK